MTVRAPFPLSCLFSSPSRCRVVVLPPHFSCKQLCFADYVVCNALLYPWLGGTANYHLVKCSFLLISFLAMASHCRTMITDPGAVPLEYQPNSLLSHEEQGNKLAMCSRCNGLKPPRAHHCSVCDRCIMKMDIHWCARLAASLASLASLATSDACSPPHRSPSFAARG